MNTPKAFIELGGKQGYAIQKIATTSLSYPYKDPQQLAYGLIYEFRILYITICLAFSELRKEILPFLETLVAFHNFQGDICHKMNTQMYTYMHTCVCRQLAGCTIFVPGTRYQGTCSGNFSTKDMSRVPTGMNRDGPALCTGSLVPWTGEVTQSTK